MSEFKSSQIDDSVRKFFGETRTHLFENVLVDGAVKELCRYCGRDKNEVRKPGGGLYEYLPCRGLVG
jgi:hypothetical protein